MKFLLSKNCFFYDQYFDSMRKTRNEKKKISFFLSYKVGTRRNNVPVYSFWNSIWNESYLLKSILIFSPQNY